MEYGALEIGSYATKKEFVIDLARRAVEEKSVIPLDVTMSCQLVTSVLGREHQARVPK
jgi:hypothetical protein